MSTLLRMQQSKKSQVESAHSLEAAQKSMIKCLALAALIEMKLRHPVLPSTMPGEKAAFT